MISSLLRRTLAVAVGLMIVSTIAPAQLPPLTVYPTYPTTAPAPVVRLRSAASRPTTTAVGVQLGAYCASEKEAADDKTDAVGAKLFEALKILQRKDADKFEHVKKSLVAYADKNPGDATPLLGLAFCGLIESDAKGLGDQLAKLAAWIDKQEVDIDALNKKEAAKPEDNYTQRDNYGNRIVKDFWDRVPDDVYLGGWIVAREILADRDKYRDKYEDADEYKAVIARAEALAAFSGGFVRYKAGSYDRNRGSSEENQKDKEIAAAFAREVEQTIPLPPEAPVQGIRAANLAELMMQVAHNHFKDNEKGKAEDVAKQIEKFMPDTHARPLRLFVALLSTFGMKREAVDWTGKYLALNPDALFQNFWDHQRKYEEAGRVDRLVALLKSVDDKVLARNFNRFNHCMRNWMQDNRSKIASKELFDHLWKLKNISQADRNALRVDLMTMFLNQTASEWYPYLHEVVFDAIRIPERKKPAEKKNAGAAEEEEAESGGVESADAPVFAASTPLAGSVSVALPALVPLVPFAGDDTDDGEFDDADDSEESVYQSPYGRGNATIFSIGEWSDKAGLSLAIAFLNNYAATPEKLEELKKEVAAIVAAHEAVDPDERNWRRYAYAKAFDAMLDLRLKNVDAALATIDALEKEERAKSSLGTCLLTLGLELQSFTEKAAIDQAIYCFEKGAGVQPEYGDNVRQNRIAVRLIVLYLKSDKPERGKTKGLSLLRENIGLLKKMGKEGHVNIDNRHYDSGSVQNSLFNVLTALIDGGCSQDVLRVYMRDCRGQTWFNDLVKSRNYNYKMKDIQQKFDSLIEKATVEEMAENIDLLIPMLPEEDKKESQPPAPKPAEPMPVE